MIAEHEQALLKIGSVPYRYNKKPGGFWISEEEELLIYDAEIEKRKRLGEIVKRVNNTNSTWLLKGPWTGVGPYKKHL